MRTVSADSSYFTFLLFDFNLNRHIFYMMIKIYVKSIKVNYYMIKMNNIDKKEDNTI